MSFDNTQSEPKKTYLNNLINLFFQTGVSLLSGSNYAFGMKTIRAMLLMIPERPKEQVQKLREKAKTIMNNNVSPEDLYSFFEEVGSILNEYYFSELQLGIIPTSTLPGEKPKPEHKPIQEHVSSKL